MPVRVDRAEEQFKKIFIGGLSSQTTDETLRDFYAQWGEIIDVIVMKDPTTKRSRGFGFVTYEKPESVDEAMTHRPHEIDGKVVESKRAIPKDPTGKSETNISVKKLYISGIRDDHTDEQLREHFSQFGTVTEVDIIEDKTTGKKRGFAFVTFDDYDAVDKCVLQKSHMIDNKRCDVKKALSKEEIRKVEMQRERSFRNDRSRGDMRGGDGYGHGGGGHGGSDWSSSSYGGGGYGAGGGGYGQGGGGYGAGGGAWAANNAWAAPRGPAAGGYGGGYGAAAGAPRSDWGAQSAWGNQGGWGQQQAPSGGQDWSRAGGAAAWGGGTGGGNAGGAWGRR